VYPRFEEFSPALQLCQPDKAAFGLNADPEANAAFWGWRVVQLGSGPFDFRWASRFTAGKQSGDMSSLFWLTDAQMARLEP
jgi:hypothetical protein